MRANLFFATAVGAALSCGAFATPILEVDYASLSTNTLVDFEGIPAGDHPGTSFDSILADSGIAFAERFVGQTLTYDSNFDVVSGDPTGPLALQVGASGENIAVWNRVGYDNAVIGGLGNVGFPDKDAIGEGALAMLFEIDQFEIGLDISGSGAGSVFLSFFDRSGGFLDAIAMEGLISGSYAFRAEGDASVIAGVVITNNDMNGVYFDNMRFDRPVPAPGVLALLSLAAIAGRSRRR